MSLEVLLLICRADAGSINATHNAVNHFMEDSGVWWQEVFREERLVRRASGE